jgi:hypothetical protein
VVQTVSFDMNVDVTEQYWDGVSSNVVASINNAGDRREDPERASWNEDDMLLCLMPSRDCWRQSWVRMCTSRCD